MDSRCELRVNADAEGDGIYLTCDCGWRNDGYSSGIAFSHIGADATIHVNDMRAYRRGLEAVRHG